MRNIKSKVFVKFIEYIILLFNFMCFNVINFSYDTGCELGHLTNYIIDKASTLTEF